MVVNIISFFHFSITLTIHSLTLVGRSDQSEAVLTPSRSPKINTFIDSKTDLSPATAAANSSDQPNLVVFIIYDAPKDVSCGSHALSLNSHSSRKTHFPKKAIYPSEF